MQGFLLEMAFNYECLRSQWTCKITSLLLQETFWSYTLFVVNYFFWTKLGSSLGNGFKYGTLLIISKMLKR